MPSYTITEPHPTVPQNTYTHSGRGGAGNFFRAPATTPSSGVPTPLTTTTSATSTAPRRFYSGRGGAGNAHKVSERPVISFAEEFARAEVREKTATISHVGRGGAGNIVNSEGKRAKKEDVDGAELSRRSTSSTTSSGRSSTSTLGGFIGRLRSMGH